MNIRISDTCSFWRYEATHNINFFLKDTLEYFKINKYRKMTALVDDLYGYGHDPSVGKL